MGNILYTFAIVLVLFWVIGFFGYGLGTIIHLLLISAIIVSILGYIRKKKSL